MSKHDTRNAGETQPPSSAAAGDDAAPSIAFLFEWNAEITRFYLSRFQKYGLLPWRLQSCRTPEDLSALQTEFQRQLVEEYMEEAARLSQIVGAGEHPAGATQDSGYAAGLLEAQKDAAAIIEQARAQADSILAAARDQTLEPAEAPEEVSKKLA